MIYNKLKFPHSAMIICYLHDLGLEVKKYTNIDCFEGTLKIIGLR